MFAAAALQFSVLGDNDGGGGVVAAAAKSYARPDFSARFPPSSPALSFLLLPMHYFKRGTTTTTLSFSPLTILLFPKV